VFARQTITKDPISVTPSVFDIVLLLGWFSYPVAINVTGNEAVLDSTAWHVRESLTIDVSSPELLLIPWVAEALGSLTSNTPDLVDSLLMGDTVVNIRIVEKGFTTDLLDLAPSWYIREPFKTGVGLPYDSFVRMDNSVEHPYADAPKNESGGIIIPWGLNEAIDTSVQSAWDFLQALDVSVTASFDDFKDKFLSDVSYGYSYPEVKDTPKIIPWGEFLYQYTRDYTYGYYYPEIKDIHKDIPWNMFVDFFDKRMELDYSHPPPKDVFKTIYIGEHWYPRWCINRFDVSYGEIAFHFISSIDQPYNQYFSSVQYPLNDKPTKPLFPQLPLDDPWIKGRMFASGLPFGSSPIARGDYDIPLKGASGGTITAEGGFLEYPIYFRDSIDDYTQVCFDGYRTGPKDSTEEVPTFPVTELDPMVVERIYIIMNSVSLIRVSDSHDVPIDGATVATDIDSWAWSFTAEVSNQAALDLIKPSAGSDPVEVKLNINGFEWNFLIESYGRAASFGKSDYTIKGRSLTAELAAPYSHPKSYTQGSVSNFTQEANGIISSMDAPWPNSIIIDPNTIDFNIAAGTFSYANKTPIEALGQLASGLGAVMIPPLAARGLTIKPRYPTSPWNWASAAASVAVHKDFFTNMSSSWKAAPLYRGIYVSGTTSSGAIAHVTRQGTNGEPYLEMVTNPLVTDSGTGGELGRNILSSTGRKEEISIDMPVLPQMAAPGILLPTELIQVDGDGATYKAQVMGTSISVAKAGAVTKVRQSVVMEKHYE
jgi:hypothetical protein